MRRGSCAGRLDFGEMAAAPRIGRRLALALLAAAVVALALGASASAAPKLQVGVGRADITPPTGYYFAGAESSKGFVRSEPAANREGHWTGAI